VITGTDDIWTELYLWTDENADGLSSIDEMMPLVSTHLTSLQTIPRESRLTDEHGNQLRYFAKAETNRGPERRMVDVFFSEVLESLAERSRNGEGHE